MDAGVPLGVILYHKPHQAQQGQVQGPAPGLEWSYKYQYHYHQYQYPMNTDGRRNGLRAAQCEGFGDTGEWKIGHDPSICAHSPEKQPRPGLIPQWGQQVRQGILPLCSDEIPCAVLHPSVFPSTGRTLNCCNGSRKGSQKLSEGWNTSFVNKGWESWDLLSLRRETFWEN